MDAVDNNQFEIKPSTKSKRKIATPCPNVYLNPALDLLANDDPMCNTAMEIVPNKKRKQTQSSDIAAFENSALDLGISKAAVNEFLVRELENVRKNLRAFDNSTKTDAGDLLPKSSNIVNRTESLNDSVVASISDISVPVNESVSNDPIYANLTEMQDAIVLKTMPNINDLSVINNAPVIIPNLGHSLDIREPLANVDNSVNLQNTVDVSTITPLESEVIDATINPQNCMEVSRIDDEIDSGISVLEQKSLNTANQLNDLSLSAINNTTHIQTNVTNQVFVNNTSNLSLSFIDRLALDSPSINQSLCFDDDLNESNIMEIKTITIITKKKRFPEKKRNTNPFLEPNLNVNENATVENPFINTELAVPEMEYNDDAVNGPVLRHIPKPNVNMPRRLFANDTNSTISTVNESSINNEQNEYENIDDYRSDSPIYENVGEVFDSNYNKQSKILGQDVSRFGAIDIMNLNKNSQSNSSNESNESKKDFKHQILRASNRLSKRVFKTLKKTFKSDKSDNNVTLNPYEVPRKLPKIKAVPKDSGIENPCLNLDNSDEIEIEEIDDEEHQYETIKTIRNTRLNMNVTPLRERANDNVDTSQNKSNTPGKKVRFDSTLNQEKVITGNSFDYGIQSPGFDAKIDKYHDELENCINERKFLQQNM